ncbi:MAG TPA: ferredoxin [Candidatus Deferrimicrobiaceae bacterium]|jgi:ferredoxin
MGKVPVVDQKECISCGVCIDVSPAVFRFNVHGKSEVFDPHGAPEEEIRQAIDLCPVACIAWGEEA